MRAARGLICAWLGLILAWGMTSEARLENDWTRPYVEKLRNLPFENDDLGTICEQVARLHLASQFDGRRFEVRSNIVYGDDVNTIGELDLVVFDRKTMRAVVVAEVKCWSDPDKAYHKGSKQQRRFDEVVHLRDDIWIWDKNEKYSPTQFHSCEYMLIGQAGTQASGFHVELQLDLADLQTLRRALIRCRQTGDCRGRR